MLREFLPNCDTFNFVAKVDGLTLAKSSPFLFAIVWSPGEIRSSLSGHLLTVSMCLAWRPVLSEEETLEYLGFLGTFFSRY